MGHRVADAEQDFCVIPHMLNVFSWKTKMFCFPRQWEYVIKERKGEDTFYNTVPFLWTS